MSAYNNSPPLELKTAEQPPGYAGPSSPGSGFPPAYDSGKPGLPNSQSTQATSGSKDEFATNGQEGPFGESVYIDGALVSGTFVKKRNCGWTVIFWFFLVSSIFSLPINALLAIWMRKLELLTIATYVQQFINDNRELMCKVFSSFHCDLQEFITFLAEFIYNYQDPSWQTSISRFNDLKSIIFCGLICSIINNSFLIGVLWIILFAKPTNNYAKTKIYTLYGVCATSVLNHIVIYAVLDTFSGSGFGPIVPWILLYPAVSALSNMTSPKAKRWLPVYYEQTQVADGGKV